MEAEALGPLKGESLPEALPRLQSSEGTALTPTGSNPCQEGDTQGKSSGFI